jgi:hypothetical protein
MRDNIRLESDDELVQKDYYNNDNQDDNKSNNVKIDSDKNLQEKKVNHENFREG